MVDGGPIDVVAAVIADDGQYLACRRSPERGGRWEFPGGKVELGEDRAAALKREILEELGIEIVVGNEIAITFEPELGIRLITFEATLVGARPISSTDHDRLAWLRPPGLQDLDWAPADLAVVAVLTAAVK